MALALAGSASLSTPRASQPAASATSSSQLVSPQAQSIVAEAKRLQVEVTSLKQETESLRDRKARWDDLRAAGTPRRVAAAADLARDAVRGAIECERAARDAETRALAARQAKDEAAREGAEQQRCAEEAARRAQDRLADFQRSFASWRRRTEAADEEAVERRRDALAATEARLSAARADAEGRERSAAELAESDVKRLASEAEQERSKLEKNMSILEARGAERRNRASTREAIARAKAEKAEERRDAQVEAAARREKRSQAAASSKEHVAVRSKDQCVMRSDDWMDDSKEEHKRTLEAARTLEEEARKDLDRRISAAMQQKNIAKAQMEEFFRVCAEYELACEKRVERVKVFLDERMALWAAEAQASEEDAERRIVEMAEQTVLLRDKFEQNIRIAEEQARLEATAAQKRSEEANTLFESHRVQQIAQAADVLAASEERVCKVTGLIDNQVKKMEARWDAVVQQADGVLALAKDHTHGRLTSTNGHLELYFEGRKVRHGMPGVDPGGNAVSS